MNDQQWLTAADAAKVLKVTTRQVHRYAEHGRLVTRRAGRRVLFSAASVAQLADDLAVDIGGFCITPRNDALRLNVGCLLLCQACAPIARVRWTTTERRTVLLKTS